jgi:hypothetical protein
MDRMSYISQLQINIIEKKQFVKEMKKKETDVYQQIVLSYQTAKYYDKNPFDFYGYSYFHLLEEKIHYETIIKQTYTMIIELQNEIKRIKSSILSQYIVFHLEDTHSNSMYHSNDTPNTELFQI